MKLRRTDLPQLITKRRKPLAELLVIVFSPGVARDTPSRTSLLAVYWLQRVVADAQRDQRCRVRHVIARLAGISRSIRGEPGQARKEPVRHPLQDRPLCLDKRLGRRDADKLKSRGPSA